MSKRVLITGHTKGIGAKTTRLLLDAGYEVIGIARSRGEEHPKLTQYQMDLSSAEGIEQACKKVQPHKFDALILNAGFNQIKPAEAYGVNEIIALITGNLTAHAALIRATVAGLLQQQGIIIGLGSFSGIEVQRWNNYYGAAKAGFHHLLMNVFEQYRKQGLKVTNIVPDITHTDFYNQQDFAPSESEDAHIKPEQVADIIFNLIHQPQTYVTTQIVIRPQRFELKRKK